MVWGFGRQLGGGWPLVSSRLSFVIRNGMMVKF